MNALVADPGAEAVATRVREHRHAGADRVSILVVTSWYAESLPRKEWRELAGGDVALTPSGKKIEVAVSRLRSSDLGKRRGVLVLNPGGPGVGGLDLPVTSA